MTEPDYNLPEQGDLPGIPPVPKQEQLDLVGAKKGGGKKPGEEGSHLPPKLGKAVRLPVPDFNDPNRPPTCLEVDFPIAQINALSQLEGNAGKPIYQMSKWWARRRSSVFRSMLIAAATTAPDDPTEAAKLVGDHYYCNHQKGGAFKKLRVLDPFMGGGTTLVEDSRLGMQMTGVDLNPVAWFIVKNELACSDPEQVAAFFRHIEAEVKPQIQPFYTTTCPRGHQGRWVDVATGKPADVDPTELQPEARKCYRWEGPEVIYTFWAKHGPCQAKGCGHRTPIFRSPVIAEKKLATFYLEMNCPDCGHEFHAELGETRMAPGAERIILEGEHPFTELSQPFAQRLKDYDKGGTQDTLDRAWWLKEHAREENGLVCPVCGAFTGKKLETMFDRHASADRASDRKKKSFKIKRKPVQMFLLVHPDWLKGTSGFAGGHELGGWAGANPKDTAQWYQNRLESLSAIEVRGKELPENLELSEGRVVNTTEGTVPKRSHFACAHCGLQQDLLDAVRPTKHTPPVMAYALQCHCPECDAQGYNYGGRYFKTPDSRDLHLLQAAEDEWILRSTSDLADYYPKAELFVSYMTHKLNGGIPNWGYTHWWKMFNTRQLLVHAHLSRTVISAAEDVWPLDVREQAWGVFQQYLRNQNMFCFWDISRDCMAPHMSNANYHPKALVIESCVFNELGRGNWQSSSQKCIEGMSWSREPWELSVNDDDESTAKSDRCATEDPLIPGQDLNCGSSTDLSAISSLQYDFVITDPPFGNNLFYADLADFFYVWLRLGLRQWYRGLPEEAYFIPERTPHAVEAIDNSIEHPDDREEYEKEALLTTGHLANARELTGDASLAEKSPNPLYRPVPSSDFYCQTLTACWAEAGRLLKPGGVMAFTFHHSEDAPWIDVLKALFDAGYLLIATYPIRSDETKGEKGTFGSRKIEYDIIHVCRKRLQTPEPVSWARMRRWVKEEAKRLKGLLEHTHGRDLPESDLRVILRGKSLEFYSRHYGQVYTGDGQVLDVRDALLGINLLLDDLIEGPEGTGALRPPESAEPASRLYLRVFRSATEIPRDELHKTLRGTGISQPDIEGRGWIRAVGRDVHVTPIRERFAYFTAPGRTRKQILKTDLDQAHFLIGAACHGSNVRIDDELNRGTFKVKKSVDDILKWYALAESDPQIRQAAALAASLVEHWRTRPEAQPAPDQMTLFDTLEEG